MNNTDATHGITSSREEYKQVCQLLESNHEQDLSRHLYTAYLTKQTRIQSKLFEFPLNEWTEWPIHWRKKIRNDNERNNEVGDLLILPGIDTTYTKSTEPRELPSRNEISATQLTGDDSLDKASGILMSEIDTTFKRLIYNKIHKQFSEGDRSRLVPVVTPEPQLPLQTRTRLLEMINMFFDDVIADSRGKINLKNWADVYRRFETVGNTSKRSLNLFTIDQKNNKYFNLDKHTIDTMKMTSVYDNNSKDNNNKKSRALRSKHESIQALPRLPENNEILASNLINIPHAPEYKWIERVQKRVKDRITKERKERSRSSRTKTTL